jgi:murein DD-endopeptidase MepM/ murein hydrolase activator NlpD
MLGPVAAVAVVAVVATPLVLARPDAPTKTTSSATAIHLLSTAQSNATERAFAQRSAAAAEVSRSTQRTALLIKVKAAKAKRAAQIRAAKARAAKAARALARRQAKARKQLRLQKIRAATLLLHQRQAQAKAAHLLYQREVRAWTAKATARRAAAHRAAAQRAAQRARARRSAVKRTFNAAHLGSPKAYAQSLVGTGSQYGCLVLLWTRESNWSYRANNPSSGAYGIPQALPGSKMASAGSDWRTNPATQIRWGLGYIRARYGTPCGAWAHSQSTGWY